MDFFIPCFSILFMDFDTPLSFEYEGYNRNEDGIKELFWTVNYPETSLRIITNVDAVIKGSEIESVPDLTFLEYLVKKGARYKHSTIDSVKELFGNMAPKLVTFLTLPWVAEHSYSKNLKDKLN